MEPVAELHPLDTRYYVCRACRARTRLIFDGFCRPCHGPWGRLRRWLARQKPRARL
jgi:hypothetical protein